MEREVGVGIGMGNTCKPMAVSFQCMTKFTTNKKIKKIKKKNTGVSLLFPSPGRLSNSGMKSTISLPLTGCFFTAELQGKSLSLCPKSLTLETSTGQQMETTVLHIQRKQCEVLT